MALTWGFTVELNFALIGVVRSRLECGKLCMALPNCMGMQYNMTTNICHRII